MHVTLSLFSRERKTKHFATPRRKFPRLPAALDCTRVFRGTVANGADPINSSGFPVPPEAADKKTRRRTSAFDHPTLSQPPLFITVQLVPGSRKKLAAAVVPRRRRHRRARFFGRFSASARKGRSRLAARRAESLRISHARCYPDAPRFFRRDPAKWVANCGFNYYPYARGSGLCVRTSPVGLVSSGRLIRMVPRAD